MKPQPIGRLARIVLIGIAALAFAACTPGSTPGPAASTNPGMAPSSGPSAAPSAAGGYNY